MALKIRLARGGAKKRPFYRIVVAEASAPRDGRFGMPHPEVVERFHDRGVQWFDTARSGAVTIHFSNRPQGISAQPHREPRVDRPSVGH